MVAMASYITNPVSFSLHPNLVSFLDKKEKEETENGCEVNLTVIYDCSPRSSPGSWDLPTPEAGRTGHKALLKGPDSQSPSQGVPPAGAGK